MLDKEGSRIACANTMWSLIDTQSGKPVRPEAEMLEKYVLDEKLDMEYAPRRIDAPEGATAGETIVIRQHHLDTNYHVNNGQYVRIAMDCLPKECRVRQLRTEYKKQCYLGDVLTPWVSSTEDGRHVVALKDDKEHTVCVVEVQE